jgi:hypothetical protein
MNLSFSDTVIALLLLVAGIYAVVFFGGPVFRKFWSLLSDLRGYNKFSKSKNRIAKIDALIKSNDYHEAAHLLISSIDLNAPRSVASITETEQQHRMILGRMLIVLEEAGEGVRVVAEIEKHLNARAELDKAMFRTVESLKRIDQKRKSAGKSTAEWGKAESKNKIKEINEELLENEKQILQALQAFHDELCQGHGEQDEVTYH